MKWPYYQKVCMAILLSWYSFSMWDKPGWFDWSWKFLCMGLSSFNDSVTHMQGFVVYVNEGLPFLWDICLKKYLFQLALRHPVPYFFFLCWSPFLPLCIVFGVIFSNRVLSINPSANVFVFGYFNIHHKDWIAYSVGTDRPGELCYNFPISNKICNTKTIKICWTWTSSNFFL